MSSGVEFDEDSFAKIRPTQSPSYGASQGYSSQYSQYGNTPSYDKKGMTGWLMRHGIKSNAAAQGILFGVIIINVIITYIVFAYLI